MPWRDWLGVGERRWKKAPDEEVHPGGRLVLDVVTRLENAHNRHDPTKAKSGYRHVYATPRGRWAAQVRVNYRKHYLGTFDDPAEAAAMAARFRAQMGRNATDEPLPVPTEATKSPV